MSKQKMGEERIETVVRMIYNRICDFLYMHEMVGHFFTLMIEK